MDSGNKIFEEIIPEGFDNEGDWELKCFLQYEKKEPETSWKKLFVFYLNKEDYIYQIIPGSSEFTKVSDYKYNIIDFRWTSDGDCIFPMQAIVVKDKKIRIEHLDFNVVKESTSISENGHSSNFANITYSNYIGYLYNSKFYYLSYETNSTNLMSGYSDNLNLSSNDESSKMKNKSLFFIIIVLNLYDEIKY